MKKHANRLLLLAALLCCSVAMMAGTTAKGNQLVAEIKVLQSFYQQYVTNLLQGKAEANQALEQRYLLDELKAKVDEMAQYTEENPLLRATGATPTMQKTLRVKPQKQQGWYDVCYSWNGKDETRISLQVTRLNGRLKIKYIESDWLKSVYGDKLWKKTDRGVTINPNSEKATVRTEMDMIKSFYTQYITNWQNNKEKANQVLMQKYLTPGLIKTLDEMSLDTDADAVIHTQDTNEMMRTTLQVTTTNQPNWYLVTYSWDGNDLHYIPVKTIRLGNKSLLRYIEGEEVTPLYETMQVADVKDERNAAPALKTFYSQYITNVLKNKDLQNTTLKQKNFAPLFAQRFNTLFEESDADPVLQAQDANENMLNSLQVKPILDNGWYEVSYSWGGQDKTAIHVNAALLNGKLVIYYIAPEWMGKQQKLLADY